MISNRIKGMRKERNLSQDQLAEITGVSKTTISYYENGIRVPDADFLVKIARYFNVSADFLLGLTEDENYAGDEDDQEVEYYAREALAYTKNRGELKQFLSTFSTTIRFISDNPNNELHLIESLSDITSFYNNIIIALDLRFDYLEELINGLVKKGVKKSVVMATAIAYIERNENNLEKMLSSISNNFIHVRENVEQSLYNKLKEIYKNIYEEELKKEDYIDYKYFPPDNPEDGYEDDKKPEMKTISILEEQLKEVNNKSKDME